MKVVLWLLALVWPMAASGQTVFFDDFEGSALLPHWSQPPPSHWEHTVSNSMLNVTALFSPGIPHLGSNFAGIAAEFSPQTDFRVDVWMGWEQGTQPHRLNLQVLGPGGNPIIAGVGYRNEAWSGEVLFFSGSTQGVSFPAPAPGIYHFTIARSAAEFQFYLEGNLIATFPDTFGTPAAGVQFFFLGPVSEPLGAFSIERVRVVPAPGLMWIPLPLGLACACRRTRRVVTTNQGA